MLKFDYFNACLDHYQACWCDIMKYRDGKKRAKMICSFNWKLSLRERERELKEGENRKIGRKWKREREGEKEKDRDIT